MNTKKTRGFRGFGVYALLILVIVCIWYWATGNSTTSTTTEAKLIEAIKADDVSGITVVQNRDIPTGKLNIVYNNKRTDTLYVSDVNAIQEKVAEAGFVKTVVNDVP